MRMRTREKKKKKDKRVTTAKTEASLLDKGAEGFIVVPLLVGGDFREVSGVVLLTRVFVSPLDQDAVSADFPIPHVRGLLELDQ